jgi:cold shock CspA family protein
MKGRVLFYHHHADGYGGYGFIAPEGELGNLRCNNFWFGPRALNFLPGYQPKSGDIVEFDEGNFKPGKGPQAARITALLNDDEVTTIEGELET